MSRKFYFEGIMLILLVLAGCQNEKYVDDSSSHTQMFTLTASKGVSSRIHLGADGKQSLWSEGDEIFVSSADGKVTGVLKLSEDDANQTSGTFSGLVTGDPSTLAYSVFPVPNSDDMTIDMSQVIGGDKLDAPMVGQIDFEKRSVAFKNSCGMIRLNLQNANGKDFTISAKNGENSVKFLTTATVNVDEYGVASLDYSASGNGTISLENAVGGFMYIPYYIDQDVTIFVDNLEVVTAEVANFKGIIKQKNVKTLTYSETTASLIAPATAEIKNENIEGETLKVDVSTATSEPSEGSTTAESHEFVNIPSITEALTGGQEGAEVEITEVVIELPKIDQTSVATKSVVSFEEIPQGVTVTIQEEVTENKSIEELTVILPSTATEADANEGIAINMPNTTVTVKSTDGKTLYIKDVIAETYDQTLVVDQNVEITSLTILKGGVQVFGQIGLLMRDAENKDEVTLVTIEVGGRVGQIEGEGFEIVDKNVAEEDKDNVVIENVELSAALQDILGAENVKLENGYAVMTKEFAESVTELFFDSRHYPIITLAGIEKFNGLTKLVSNGVGLKTADLHNNIALKHIQLEGDDVTSLNVSGLTSVEVFILQDSKLDGVLDLSHMNSLSELNLVMSSELDGVKYGSGKNMKKFYIDNCRFSGIWDFSAMTKIVELSLGGTGISELILPETTTLKLLNVAGMSGLFDGSSQKLATICAEYPGLETLNCHNNALTTLDLSMFNNLKTLICFDNMFEGVFDVSGCTTLTDLYCGSSADDEYSHWTTLKLNEDQKALWESSWKNDSRNQCVKLYSKTDSGEELIGKEVATWEELKTAVQNPSVTAIVLTAPIVADTGIGLQGKTLSLNKDFEFGEADAAITFMSDDPEAWPLLEDGIFKGASTETGKYLIKSTTKNIQLGHGLQLIAEGNLNGVHVADKRCYLIDSSISVENGDAIKMLANTANFKFAMFDNAVVNGDVLLECNYVPIDESEYISFIHLYSQTAGYECGKINGNVTVTGTNANSVAIRLAEEGLITGKVTGGKVEIEESGEGGNDQQGGNTGANDFTIEGIY